MLTYHSGLIAQMKRLKGAVRSGSPAARLGILLKALAPMTHLVDRMVCRASDDGVAEKELPPCLMIVSPPRSGSTITYQVLARVIPSVYISNLHFLFPVCSSSFMLKNDLFGANLTGFRNYYGHTSSLYDVNEGNELVEAIVGDSADRSLIRQRFIRFVKAMRATSQQPLIFKNVQAYPHILRLHKAVPKIIFLRVKRDPEQVIQSVVRAYHELGSFHPVPPALLEQNITDPVEFAARQILEIERIIDSQRKQINPSVWLEWQYEDFCADTWPMIEHLAEKYLHLNLRYLRREAITEPLQTSNRIKVSADEADRISSLLQQYRQGERLKKE